jgi:hypothetical protein
MPNDMAGPPRLRPSMASWTSPEGVFSGYRSSDISGLTVAAASEARANPAGGPSADRPPRMPTPDSYVLAERNHCAAV